MTKKKVGPTEEPGFSSLSLGPLTPADERNFGFGPGCEYRGTDVCFRCDWAVQIPYECNWQCSQCEHSGTCPCSDPAQTDIVAEALCLPARKKRSSVEERRDQIYEHIRLNPGCTARNIFEALGITRGGVRDHLDYLEAVGKIRFQHIRVGTYNIKTRSYYATEGGV